MTFSAMWVPLVVAALTAAATLSAVIVTSFFNLKVTRLNIGFQSNQRSKELRIEKLEELYFLFHKWEVYLIGLYLNYLSCYKKKITYRQVLEMANKNDMLAPGDTQKYRMILHMYFPSLNKEYDKVDHARGGVVRFFSDPLSNGLDVADFLAAQKIFDASCREFRDKISDLAQEILSSK